MGLGREAGDVTDLDQQPCGTGGSDAVQVQQAGAGLLDQLGELLVRGLLPRIDLLQVSDQLGRDPATGLADDVSWSDLGQQRLGLRRGQVPLRPAGDQLEQQLVQLAGLAGVVLTQRPPPVDQQAQDL